MPTSTIIGLPSGPLQPKTPAWVPVDRKLYTGEKLQLRINLPAGVAQTRSSWPAGNIGVSVQYAFTGWGLTVDLRAASGKVERAIFSDAQVKQYLLYDKNAIRGGFINATSR